MDYQYPDVRRCRLDATERRVTTVDESIPLVLKPIKSSNKEFLQEFLNAHSSQILNDTAKHGALLLRGFAIQTATDFEQQILSIQGLCGLREVLFVEPGRTIQGGTHFVLGTNSFYKTGGALSFGTFHTENYHTPDVPRYVAFFCVRPPNLGGETGLANTAKLYADLPERLRLTLESRACLSYLFPIAEMARRYELGCEAIHEFCHRNNLPVVSIDGAQFVAVYKPSVIQHPVTQENSLSVNFGSIQGMRESLKQSFLTDYAGIEWALHRMLWKTSWLENIYERARTRRLKKIFDKSGDINVSTMTSPLDGAITLATLFSKDDCRLLARSMRRHYSSFIWKQGDILLLDNLKIAHCGMPGYGERELGVVLCNTIRLDAKSGLYIAKPSDESKESLGAELLSLRVRNAFSVRSAAALR